MFDNVKNPIMSEPRRAPGEVLAELQKHHAAHPGLVDDTAVQLSGKVVFGIGCNLQEHVMFGMCMDGMCGRRGQAERTLLLCNDEKRLIGNLDLLGTLQMMEETPAERREKIRMEQKAKTEQVQEQLRGTLMMMRPAKEGDAMAGHKQAAMLRGLEADSEIDAEVTPGMLPPRDQGEGHAALSQRVKARKAYKELTPLHIAAHRCDLPGIERLASLGYDINDAEKKSGQTALHIAAKRNNVEAIDFLLAIFGGVLHIDHRDTNGDTALHIACRSGFDEVTALLCDAGADPMVSKNVSTVPLRRSAKSLRIPDAENRQRAP
jgi:hypothetical protein